MRRTQRQFWCLAAAAAITAFVSFPAVHAETRTVRIAKQYGVSYLPLTIMEEKNLLESEGRKLGLDLKTDWLRFTGGPPMNEAIVSGNLDFASGGVGPLLTAWARTKNNIQIKGIAAINAMPLWLNTIDPKVKTIKDFTAKDRIALPAVRVSIQAVVLEMAAEKVFGKGHAHKLDPLTVSLSHPDGLAQMMSFKSQITGHLTSAPYMYIELQDKRVHRVLDSYDVLGGPHTFNSIWATAKLYEKEPKLVKAFLAALKDSEDYIKAHPDDAAALWVKNTHSKLPVAEVADIIKKPENHWTMTPQKIMVFADFMSRIGMIPVKPSSWKDVYVKEIHNLPGS